MEGIRGGVRRRKRAFEYSEEEVFKEVKVKDKVEGKAKGEKLDLDC